jgi:hypothetical protein
MLCLLYVSWLSVQNHTSCTGSFLSAVCEMVLNAQSQTLYTSHIATQFTVQIQV